MRNPFVYGEEVSGEAFCNRQDEIRELINDVRNCQNVLIFSPRRMGKTSLIKEVLRQVEGEGILPVYVDLYPAVTKEYFIQTYAKAISRSLKGTVEKVVESLRRLLPHLMPKLLIKGEGLPDFEFDFDRSGDVLPVLDTLLAAPAKIAAERERNAVVVFDEFQEIANYRDPEIERKMRSTFQTHQNVGYIFLGSKRHLLYDLFDNPNRPFYKSCKHFPLGKIPEGDLLGFIEARFARGQVEIDEKTLGEIVSLSECHPYYVQFLCHIIWDDCVDRDRVEPGDVDAALEKLLRRESAAYTILWDSLAQKQKELLIALSKEERPDIYSHEFLRKHSLGSPSSVQKALGVLIRRDIVDRENDKYSLADIFLKRWVLRTYELSK